MPQISLYIDEITLKKVESAAMRQHVSISKWVADQIRKKVDPTYPIGFEDLFGAITDPSFKRPDTMTFSNDSRRESF